MPRTQTIFDLETSRGVLIVSPRGDAVSFLESDVHRSVETVRERIRELDHPLVVADLGQSKYFGSIIIGAIASFAELARESGGEFATCNVSQDMLGVLRVMRLEDHWTILPTRKEAVKFVRKAAR